MCDCWKFAVVSIVLVMVFDRKFFLYYGCVRMLCTVLQYCEEMSTILEGICFGR